MMKPVDTPSGLRAKLIIPNRWGPERKSAGLQYIGSESRRRLKEVFTMNANRFDLLDIAADMQEFGFGYIDDLHIPVEQLQPCYTHLFPTTNICDDIPNCLWHMDKLRFHVLGEEHAILQPKAVTFLYPILLDRERPPKETGFAHPAHIAESLNALYDNEGNEPLVDPNSMSLRQFAEDVGGTMHTETNYQQRLEFIELLLRKTYTDLTKLFQETGIESMKWIPQKPGRLVFFGNEIVHCNDLVKQGNNYEPRKQMILRRMLPGTETMGFNWGT